MLFCMFDLDYVCNEFYKTLNRKTNLRSSHQRCSMKKNVHKKFTKFTDFPVPESHF